MRNRTTYAESAGWDVSVQQSTAPSQVQRFSDKYLKFLHQEGIRHPFDQWYVKPAEAFLRSSPRRFSERSAGDVDWNYRLDSARTLAKDHPTVARSMDQLPQTKAATGDDRSDKGSLADARKTHVELITKLARAKTLSGV